MKTKSNLNFSEKLFYNPNFAYVLGLIWADGYVAYNPQKSKWQVSVSLIEEDMLDLKHIFQSFGSWFEFYHKPQGYSFKRQLKLGITHRKFVEFLIKNDFQLKSNASPHKILSCLPENLHLFFWRGYIDGDGCFYFNEKYQSCKHAFTLAGSIDQDWEAAKNILSRLKINYSINRRISQETEKTSTGSWIIIQSSADIVKWGDFIYGEAKKLNIGLDRKFQKFLLIKTNQRKIKTSNYKFVWKNGRFYCYDFKHNGARYRKSGFLSEEEAWEEVKTVRKNLGLNESGKRPILTHIISS